MKHTLAVTMSISIHALRMERDDDTGEFDAVTSISIHALRMERDELLILH